MNTPSHPSSSSHSNPDLHSHTGAAPQAQGVGGKTIVSFPATADAHSASTATGNTSAWVKNNTSETATAMPAHISPGILTQQTHLHYLEEQRTLCYAQAVVERLSGITEQARLRYIASLLADYDKAWMVDIQHLIDADEASYNEALTEEDFMTLDAVADELRKARKLLREPYILPRLMQSLGDVFTKYAAAIKHGPEHPTPERADENGHRDDLGKPDYSTMIQLMKQANEKAAALKAAELAAQAAAPTTSGQGQASSVSDYNHSTVTGESSASSDEKTDSNSSAQGKLPYLLL